VVRIRVSRLGKKSAVERRVCYPLLPRLLPLRYAESSQGEKRPAYSPRFAGTSEMGRTLHNANRVLISFEPLPVTEVQGFARSRT
jgi:hypothetical protein